MAAIVDFVCIRVHNEIGKYMKTQTIPDSLVNGDFSVEDILRCLDSYGRFNDDERLAAKDLIKNYQCLIQRKITEIEHHFKQEYTAVLNNLQTEKDDFRFNLIMQKHRDDINPVTALYHETRQMLLQFSPTNETHAWLMDLITDPVFMNKLISAIDADIRSLERIVKAYGWPLKNINDNTIPLELFHANHLISDLKDHKKAFQLANIWDDE